MLTLTTTINTVREASGETLSAPGQVARDCADCADSAQEMILAVDLNARNRIIERRLIALGIADACLTHPREVFRGAIQNGAKSVILVHNHPSGDTTPSEEDLKITRQMIEAGKIIEIKVMDHVVIGKKDGVLRWCSMREDGLANFD